MFLKDRLHHKWTCSTNTFQDPSYKDNLPFSKSDIFEHLHICKLCLYVINFVFCSLENVCWYFFYKNFPLRLTYLLKTITLVSVRILHTQRKCFPLRLNYLLKTGLTWSQQTISAILNYQIQPVSNPVWPVWQCSLIGSETSLCSLSI